ncbi:hypothetical protein D3C86_1272760 [compost metagenome]
MRGELGHFLQCGGQLRRHRGDLAAGPPAGRRAWSSRASVGRRAGGLCRTLPPGRCSSEAAAGGGGGGLSLGGGLAVRGAGRRGDRGLRLHAAGGSGGGDARRRTAAVVAESGISQRRGLGGWLPWLAVAPGPGLAEVLFLSRFRRRDRRRAARARVAGAAAGIPGRPGGAARVSRRLGHHRAGSGAVDLIVRLRESRAGRVAGCAGRRSAGDPVAGTARTHSRRSAPVAG